MLVRLAFATASVLLASACVGNDADSIPVSISAACTPAPTVAREPVVLRVFDTCSSPCEEVQSTHCDAQLVGNRVEVRATAEVELHEMCGAVCELVEVACELPPLPAGTHEIVFPDGQGFDSMTIEIGAPSVAAPCQGDLDDEECVEVCAQH